MRFLDREERPEEKGRVQQGDADRGFVEARKTRSDMLRLVIFVVVLACGIGLPFSSFASRVTVAAVACQRHRCRCFLTPDSERLVFRSNPRPSNLTDTSLQVMIYSVQST